MDEQELAGDEHERAIGKLERKMAEHETAMGKLEHEMAEHEREMGKLEDEMAGHERAVDEKELAEEELELARERAEEEQELASELAADGRELAKEMAADEQERASERATDEKERVLDMVADGKITVDEAVKLLAAVSQTSSYSGLPRKTARRRIRRVEVDDDIEEELATEHDDSFAVGDSPKLVVNNTEGNIEVAAGSDSTIRVRSKLNHPSRVDYRVTQEGDTIKVAARKRKRSSIFGLDFLMGKGAETAISVSVPTETYVSLKTVAGAVRLHGVDGGGKLRATSGSIDATDVKGAYDLGLVTGTATLRGMEGSAKLRATTGKITMKEVKGEFNAKIITGPISFNGEMTPGGTNRFSAITGSVRIALRGAPSLNIKASCIAGVVSCKLPAVTLESSGPSIPGMGNRFVGTVGQGEADLAVDAVTGSIKIEPAEPTAAPPPPHDEE